MSNEAIAALTALGHRCHVVTRWSDVDTDALERLIEQAWRHDYTDEVHPRLGGAFLQQLTRGGNWLAAVCEDRTGKPVGFEVAVPRRLIFGQQSYSCWYVTAFSVDPDSRRRGVGTWVLETINNAVFGERGADLVFSTFEGSKAGSVTVQATYDAHGLAVRRFHESPVYVLRADARQDLPESPGLAAIERVYAGQDGQLKFVGEHASRRALPTVSELTAAVQASHAAAFAIEASFSDQLLCTPKDDTGSYWFEFGNGRWCWVTCTVTHLGYNDAAIGTSLLMQTVLHSGCSQAQLRECVAELARMAFRSGHRALVAYDHSQVSVETLLGLRFAPSGRFFLSVRGSTRTVARLEQVAPPYFLDFT